MITNDTSILDLNSYLPEMNPAKTIKTENCIDTVINKFSAVTTGIIVW